MGIQQASSWTISTEREEGGDEKSKRRKSERDAAKTKGSVERISACACRLPTEHHKHQPQLLLKDASRPSSASVTHRVQRSRGGDEDDDDNDDTTMRR